MIEANQKFDLPTFRFNDLISPVPSGSLNRVPTVITYIYVITYISHSGRFDFTLNQYLTRENYLPYVVFSQPSKPGKLLVVTKNERKIAGRSIGQAFKMDIVFSDGAIMLVICFGLLSMVAIAMITKIQGIHFTMYNAWDVMYG